MRCSGLVALVLVTAASLVVELSCSQAIDSDRTGGFRGGLANVQPGKVPEQSEILRGEDPRP